MTLPRRLPHHSIKAVTVNHNTSAYLELMVRSLFARHPHGSGLSFSLSIYDNNSQDDLTDLKVYTESQGIPIIQSGFTTETQNNSHGEVLRQFVMENPDPTHYLFLDSDVCFLDDLTLHTMLIELENAPDAFGIGPRMSWDGIDEIPQSAMDDNPDIRDARLHPCCALVKNTSLFRMVVEEIGLSSAKYLWANAEEILDTFKLMTRVMKTHGLRHTISSKMILHFFCVSYVWEPTEHWNEAKAKRRDALLAQFRNSF